MPTTPFEFHNALTKANINYSGLSWNDFNVFGDQKSLDEIRRLMRVESRLSVLEKIYAQYLGASE